MKTSGIIKRSSDKELYELEWRLGYENWTTEEIEMVVRYDNVFLLSIIPRKWHDRCGDMRWRLEWDDGTPGMRLAKPSDIPKDKESSLDKWVKDRIAEIKHCLE